MWKPPRHLLCYVTSPNTVQRTSSASSAFHSLPWCLIRMTEEWRTCHVRLPLLPRCPITPTNNQSLKHISLKMKLALCLSNITTVCLSVCVCTVLEMKTCLRFLLVFSSTCSLGLGSRTVSSQGNHMDVWSEITIRMKVWSGSQLSCQCCQVLYAHSVRTARHTYWTIYWLMKLSYR